MPVFAALAGMQGVNLSSIRPIPDASGAVHCVKCNVPLIVPVTVASLVAAAVAFARIENPQIKAVFPPDWSVAVVAAVVPVAEAVVAVAPAGY